jgi:hypothetical protein
MLGALVSCHSWAATDATAPTPEAAQCDDGEVSWVAFRDAETKAGWRMHELGDTQRIAFMARYNAIPPRSSYQADRVYIASHDPQEGFAKLGGYVIVLDECVLDAEAVSPMFIETMIATLPKETK